MVKTPLGKVITTFGGNFVLGTAYTKLTEVYDTTTNATYCAKFDNQNIPVTDTATWQMIAKGVGTGTGQSDNNYSDAAKAKVDALPTQTIDTNDGLASYNYANNNYNITHENMNGIISSFAKKLQAGEVTKIKLIGDSITEGYGATGHINIAPNVNNGNPSFMTDSTGQVWYEALYTDNSWANYFRRYITLNFPSVSFVNAGIGGKDTTWALANEAHWIGTEDVVFVMLGANDRWNMISATYKSQLSQFLTYVKAHCNQMIVMTNNPMPNDYNNLGNVSTGVNFTMNQIDMMITEICNENGYSYISFYREMMRYSKLVGIDIQQFEYDGIHPDDLGHELMWNILQKCLGISDDYSKSISTYINRDGADKQFITDGNFQIAQMCPTVGTEISNPAGYTYPVFDMWKVAYYIGESDILPTTIKHSQRKITDSGAAINSVPGSQYCYRINVSDAGSTAMSEYSIWNITDDKELKQYCLNNSELIVSLYARSNISGKKIACVLRLNYGTGGSPSEDQFLTSGLSPILLTNTWRKYYFIFKMPNFDSKTFGTNNDSYLATMIQLAGNFQNFGGAGDIEITQVCIGSQYTKFKPKSFDDELKNCQKYLEKTFSYSQIPVNNTQGEYASMKVTANNSAKECVGFIPFKVQKRSNNGLITYYNPFNTSNGIRVYETNANVGIVSNVINENGISEITLDTSSVAGNSIIFQCVYDCRR